MNALPQHINPPMTARRRRMEPYYYDDHNVKMAQRLPETTAPAPVLEQLLHAIYSSENRHHRIQALQYALQLFSSFSTQKQQPQHAWDVRAVSQVLCWRLERSSMEAMSLLSSSSSPSLSLLLLPTIKEASIPDTSHCMTAAYDSPFTPWMELALICANLHIVWSVDDRLIRETFFPWTSAGPEHNHNTLHWLLQLIVTLHQTQSLTSASSNSVFRPQPVRKLEYYYPMLEATWRALQLIRLWAKLKEGTTALLSYQAHNYENIPQVERHRQCEQAHSNSCWIVATLVNLLWILSDHQELDHHGISPKIQAEAVGLLKNLSFRSSPVEKTVMYQVDGLLSFLLRWCELEIKQQHNQHGQQLEESVASIFWNLALHPDLSRDMVQHVVIPRALSSILSRSTNLKARRNATSALGNMVVSCLGQTKQRSDTQSNAGVAVGIWQEEWLIKSLMSRVQHDEDPDTRRRAMRTLRCMVGHCPVMRHERSDLLPFLLNAVVAQPTGNTNIITRMDNGDSKDESTQYDEDDDALARHLDAQLQACEALAHLARDATWLQQQGPRLEAGLIAIIQRSREEEVFSHLPSAAPSGRPTRVAHPKIVLSIARVLSHCIEHSPWTRSLSCYSEVIFTNLYHAIRCLKIDDDHASAHLSVSRLLQQLITLATTNSAVTCFPANPNAAQTMASTSSANTAFSFATTATTSSSKPSFFVAHTAVLDLLTLIVCQTGQSRPDEYEPSIRVAIDIVLALLNAGHEGEDAMVIHAMAEHDGLLTALVNVCLTTQDLDLKSNVKQAIMTLVPKL